MPYLLLPQEGQFFRNVRKALAKLYEQAKTKKLNQRVVVIYGDDEFLVERIVRRLTDLIVSADERPFALTILSDKDATEDNLSKVLSEPTFSLPFVSHRVIVVKNPDFISLKDKKFRQKQEPLILRQLKNLPKGVFVLVSFSETLSTIMQGIFDQIALLVPVSKLRPQDLPEFVRMLAEQANLTVDKHAVQEIIDRVGNDARQLANEMEKITLFVGMGGNITVKTVQELVQSVAFDVFSLMDAISDGNEAKALQILNGLLERKEHPMRIVYLLARQFRFLLQARLFLDEKLIPSASLYTKTEVFRKQLDQIPEELINRLPTDHRYNLLKQSPTVIRSFLQKARAFTVTKILEALRFILDTDVRLKMGVEQDQQLAVLILQLCRLRQARKESSTMR